MVDRQKVEQAIRLYLEGIGEDVNREGLLDTPSRIARMCEEVFGGLDRSITRLERTQKLSGRQRKKQEAS